MPSTRVFGFQIWSDDLVKFKQKLGLPLGKKLDISIPVVFLDDRETKISVLRGIFDTDGSINLENKNNKLYPRIYITTICPTLANQLIDLFNKEGLRATKYSSNYKGNFNRQTSYRVIIRGDEMFHRFIGVIKPANPKHNAKYFLYRKSFK
jgi:intein/homing endonuclease